MGPYLLAALFLAIPPQVLSPSFQSNVRFNLERNTATQAINGVVREVRFIGLKRIFSEALQAHIKSRVGDPLDQRIVERDVRALAGLGWFDSVTAEVLPIGDEPDLCLMFELEERPYLSEVTFRGSNLLSRDRILQLLADRKIFLKVSTPVDRAQLWRASRLIRGELQTLGHPLADVHVVLEQVSTAAVRARFQIQDGPRVAVTQVTFSGNQAFPGKVLQEEMRRITPKAHVATLRHKNVYTPEHLEQDLDRIAEYYRNHGYATARVGVPVFETDYVFERRRFFLRHEQVVPQLRICVPISEGMLYRFGQVEVLNRLSAAPSNKRDDVLISNSGLNPGAAYSQQKIESLRNGLSIASKTASALSAVDVRQQLDTVNGIATAIFSVHSQNPYILRQLNFSGEQRFSDRYYRRRIPLREGEAFDSEKLRSGLERLVRTGYVRSFKPEDIRLQFDEAKHNVDVSIRVTEVGQQKISLIGGWNNLGGTIGAAYSIFNLLGGEELIDSHIDVGPDSLHLALRIAEESLFGSRVTASFTVFQDVVRPHLPGVLGNRPFFSTRNAGYAVGWGYPISLDETLITNYTISHQSTQYAVELPPNLTGVTNNQDGSSASVHSFGFDWVSQGSSQHWDAGTSVAGGRLGGDENFLRSSLEYDRVRPDPLTNGRNSWAVRSYVSGVSSFRGDLLFQNRYFAGDELLRGFRHGEMTPYAVEDLTDSSGKGSFQAIPAGADLLIAINAEYRVPVAPRTQLVGFYDTGSGWLLPNWLGPDRPVLLSGTNGILRASTGTELRWQIPYTEQPLRLDLAFNPLRLAKSLLLPDGSHFRTPDRLFGWTWGLGPLF